MARFEAGILGFGALLTVGVVAEVWSTDKIWSILVAIGVAGEVTIGLLHAVLASRLRGLAAREKQESAEEIVRLSAAVAEANARASEANAKAEEDRLARIKLEERLAFRVLTKEQTDAMVAVLRQHPAAVTIQSVSSLEADLYSQQFERVLGDSGWSVESVVLMDANPIGLGMMVRDVNAAPLSARTLNGALDAAKIGFGAVSDPEAGEGVILVIGHKGAGGLLGK
mgnify:CR=1 FL=1